MGRDIAQLHPRLQNAVRQLQKLCAREGLTLGIGECFRSVAEQDALYAQGRTAPGSIVTNVPGRSYSSQHQWGIAFDFFKNVSGHAYDDDGFFSRVGALGKSLGLGWGGDWKDFPDRPHLYLPDWGSTPALLKQRYGTFERFRASWNAGEGDEKPGAFSASPLIRDGQIHLNNYVNAGLETDGFRGSATKKAGVKAVQQAMNMDYGAGLAVDGIWGFRSENALKGHYVEYGENQELVRTVQILLLLRDTDPGGVDGSFGDGMLAAVKKYQSGAGLMVDGVAGYNTIRSLAEV